MLKKIKMTPDKISGNLNKKVRNITNFRLISGLILVLIVSTLAAAVVVKFTYHQGFIKDCYRVCYYNKSDTVWEYRPWGYDVEFTEENRDFPSLDTCLGYCMSQKQIDFIK